MQNKKNSEKSQIDALEKELNKDSLKKELEREFWKAVKEHGTTNVLQFMFDHYCH